MTAANRVVLARLISAAGGHAGFFVGIWGTAAYELDATPGTLAALSALLAGGTLVGSLIAGVVIDRTDVRRGLLFGEALFVPLILVVAMAETLASLAVLGCLAWFALAFVHTSIASFPPALSADPREVERLNARLEAATSLSLVAGPAIGAGIVAISSLPWVFVLDAATSVVALALVAGIRLQRPDATVAPAPGRAMTELRAGLRHAYGSRAIRLMLIAGTLTWLSFGVFTALEPLFFRDVLRTGPEALGWVNSLFGLGLVGGAVALERSAGRLTNARTAVLLTGACGVGAMVYTGPGTIPGVVVGAVLWGSMLGALLPLLRTVVQLNTEPGMTGRVMGVFQMQHQVGELLPLAAAPALATLIGVQGVLVATGGMLLVGGMVLWGPARRLDASSPTVGPGVPPPAVAVDCDA